MSKFSQQADPCIVPGSNIEYFDCCNRVDSSKTESICDSIGALNLIGLISIVLFALGVLCLQKLKFYKSWLWQGQNLILVFVQFFHVLTMIWRVLLFLHYGHPDKNVEQKWYITWKSSAAGDIGNTICCFAVYLLYMINKYQDLLIKKTLLPEEQQKKKDDERNQCCLSRLSYLVWMWIAAVAYSTAWGFGLVMAYDDLNLKDLDLIMTVFFLIFSLYLAHLSIKLISTVKKLEQEGQSFSNNTSTMLKHYLIGFVLALIAQAVFIPLTSSNLTPASQKNGQNGWNYIILLQAIADLSISALVFSVNYIMYQVDIFATIILESQDSDDKNSKQSILQKSNKIY